MFRKFLLIMVLMFCPTAFGEVDTSEITFSTVTSGTFDQSLRGWINTLNTDIVNAAGLSNMGTGVVFYVDSGAGNTATVDGLSLRYAFASLDDAFDTGNVTANRGDVVFVVQGHNESLTVTDSIDADVPGVTVIGIGRGSLKPTFDYDTNRWGEFVIGAANITIYNLRFRVSTTSVRTAIDVEDAGDDFAILSCEFGYPETSGDEFLIGITIEDNVDDGLIDGCFLRCGANGSTRGIHVVSSTAGLVITNNHIQGDYSTAPLAGSDGTYAENIIVKNNLFFNGTMSGDGEINTVLAMTFAEGSSGLVQGNTFVGNLNTALLVRTGDDMVFVNNFINTIDGDEYSGTIESNGSSVTATPSA